MIEVWINETASRFLLVAGSVVRSRPVGAETVILWRLADMEARRVEEQAWQSSVLADGEKLRGKLRTAAESLSMKLREDSRIW